MSSEWKECSLGDLIEIRHGYAFPGEHISKTESKCVLVTPGNFEIGGGYKHGSVKYFHGEYPQEYIFASGDLAVTMTDLSKTADTLGYSAKIPGEKGMTYLHNQRVGKVSSKSPEAELDYIYWLMRHGDYRSWIVNTATGSTVKHTSPSRILEYSFLLPPVNEQKAIAHILGTLDDKIELNRKTNETLEAMAKALFKSWFVDFDPVRVKADGRPTGLPAEISDLFPDSFEDSELGEIPSGWRVAELGDISTISGGKQLESVELKSKGRFPVYGANGTMGFHDLATHNSFVIVFGRVGAYCGSINWEYGGAWVNNNASSVIPLRYHELVLQWMLEADYSNYRTGSAQPFIPNGALACSPVLMPTDALASAFCDLLLPIRLKQKKNQSAALSLVEIRDAILPKLISGEIRIPDAERMLEEVGV